MKYFMHLRKFTTVSVTGPACWLNCRFCKGKYLAGMTDISRNTERVLKELYEAGVKGILVSGGFTREGYLPINGFVDALREAKRRYGFIYNIHLGLQRDRSLLESLRGVIDVVDYEFTLSNYIIKYVRNLKYDGEVYIDALERMLEAGLHVVPHLYLWHPGFEREVFREELRALSDLGLREATLLVYIPESRDIIIPRGEVLLENLREARRVFHGELYLGCMRPYEVKKEIDKQAVEEGLVERIANPHHELLTNRGRSEVYDACCSLPEHLLSDFRMQTNHLPEHSRTRY